MKARIRTLSSLSCKGALPGSGRCLIVANKGGPAVTANLNYFIRYYCVFSLCVYAAARKVLLQGPITETGQNCSRIVCLSVWGDSEVSHRYLGENGTSLGLGKVETWSISVMYCQFQSMEMVKALIACRVLQLD